MRRRRRASKVHQRAARATERAVRTVVKPRIAPRAMHRLTAPQAQPILARLAQRLGRLRAARLIGRPASKANFERRRCIPLLLMARGSPLSRALFQDALAQSPAPGLGEKYLSNFPVSSQYVRASAGMSFLPVLFGHFS